MNRARIFLATVFLASSLAGFAFAQGFGGGSFGASGKHRVQVAGAEKKGVNVINYGTGLTCTGPSSGVLTCSVLGGAPVPQTRTLTAGSGLTGGGDLTADRTFTVVGGAGLSVGADLVDLKLSATGGLAKNLGAGTDELGIGTGGVANAMLANSSLTVTASTGLSGGGSVSLGGATSFALANTAVAPGSYGLAASVSSFTVDAQGRLTAASNTAIDGLDVAAIDSGTLGVARGGTGIASAGAIANRAFYTADGTSFVVGTLPNAALANSQVTVTAGTGLSGGGAVSLGGSMTLNLANTAVIPASYGSATQVGSFTVDAQGRLTAASGVAIGSLDTSVLTAGVVPIPRGGTNASAIGAAGSIAYSSAGTALGFSAAGNAGEVALSGGAGAPTWSTTTGSGAVVLATSPTLGGTIAGTYTLGGTPTLGATLALNGQTLAGTATFSGAPITFSGDVDFGDATTDTVSLTSRIDTGMSFIQGTNRFNGIDQSTTLGAAGANLQWFAGAGAAGSGATAGATGGALTLRGGSGGAGTVSAVGGVGGGIVVEGNGAGANNGGGGNTGGGATIRGGNGTGGSANGTVTIGATQTGAVNIGVSTITTTIAGITDVAQVNVAALLLSETAPTISSGFGTSPSITVNNGTAAFRLDVGTGGTASSGVIGLPTATTGWNCYCVDITTTSASVFLCKQTASSTTTATIRNFNTAAAETAWVASDVLAVSCFAF